MYEHLQECQFLYGGLELAGDLLVDSQLILQLPDTKPGVIAQWYSDALVLAAGNAY